jgi:hypothetical protein
VALANAPSKAVADQCPVVKTRKRNRRRVLTWFAGRWRSYQPKRAEKPHSKFNLARGWTALPRGRRLRLPRRMASGSRQPPQGERQMSAREREPGGLPPPNLSLFNRKVGQGHFVFMGNLSAPSLVWQKDRMLSPTAVLTSPRVAPACESWRWFAGRVDFKPVFRGADFLSV